MKVSISSRPVPFSLDDISIGGSSSHCSESVRLYVVILRFNCACESLSDGGNLITVSNYLTMNDIKILSVDFEEALKDAKKGDFVYFDPPYDSDTNTFNSYTEGGFGKEDQRRLARVFKELDDRGVYVMLSNHNTTLIRELYEGYNINVIEAKRNINSNGSKRGKVEELIITNFVNKEGF